MQIEQFFPIVAPSSTIAVGCDLKVIFKLKDKFLLFSSGSDFLIFSTVSMHPLVSSIPNPLPFKMLI